MLACQKAEHVMEFAGVQREGEIKETTLSYFEHVVGLANALVVPYFKLSAFLFTFLCAKAWFHSKRCSHSRGLCLLTGHMAL